MSSGSHQNPGTPLSYLSGREARDRSRGLITDWTSPVSMLSSPVMRLQPSLMKLLAVLFLFGPLGVSRPAQEQNFQTSFDSYVKGDGIVGAAYVMVNEGQ